MDEYKKMTIEQLKEAGKKDYQKFYEAAKYFYYHDSDFYVRNIRPVLNYVDSQSKKGDQSVESNDEDLWLGISKSKKTEDQSFIDENENQNFKSTQVRPVTQGPLQIICPFCRKETQPVGFVKISQAGWILFGIGMVISMVLAVQIKCPSGIQVLKGVRYN